MVALPTVEVPNLLATLELLALLAFSAVVAFAAKSALAAHLEDYL
ncbi:hypothetical protein [Megamonas funiformis]|nr:hypothetical protein [Megamonas funiformis]